MATVLILGAKDDAQVVRVSDEITRRKGRVLLVDTEAFPARDTLSITGDGIAHRGKPLPRTIASVYLRALGINPLLPEYRTDLKTRPEGLFAQLDERFAQLASLLLILQSKGARIVNDLEANAQHSRKPYQLALLKQAGLTIPKFLASNDPAAVKTFVREVRAVVYKPLSGGATVQKVKRSDLTRDRLASLQLAPVLFQEFVEGVSVRVYVVGGKCVAAAEIHSTELDYRRKEDAVVATKLSPDERRACIAAARACGMAFAGVDLIRGVKQFVVLECNPSPMFAVFEEKTGLDVAGPLAVLLVK